MLVYLPIISARTASEQVGSLPGVEIHPAADYSTAAQNAHLRASELGATHIAVIHGDRFLSYPPLEVDLLRPGDSEVMYSALKCAAVQPSAPLKEPNQLLADLAMALQFDSDSFGQPDGRLLVIDLAAWPQYTLLGKMITESGGISSLVFQSHLKKFHTKALMSDNSAGFPFICPADFSFKLCVDALFLNVIYHPSRDPLGLPHSLIRRISEGKSPAMLAGLLYAGACLPEWLRFRDALREIA